MKAKSSNRILDGLLNWTEKESRFREVFGKDISNGRDFLQTKRGYFNDLYRTCRQNPNPEEKIMLALVRGEIRRMDKHLYPNAAIRAIARLSGTVKDWITTHRGRGASGNEVGSLTVKHAVRLYRREGQKVIGSRQESKDKSISDYLSKRTGVKPKKKDKVPADTKDSLIPKRRSNPNNSHGIH